MRVVPGLVRSFENRFDPETDSGIYQKIARRAADAAYQHLTTLERKGFIQLKGHSRGIALLAPSGLPVLGRVAAGTPILAEENIERYLALDSSLFHPQADFLLRVRGMSMRDVGILDGDLLAVHKTPLAENKQIVVARLDNKVTVKRFRRRRNIVTLLPENPDFAPLRVDLRKRDVAIDALSPDRTKPAVVVAQKAGRVEVLDCNRAARLDGIRPAMPLAAALSLKRDLNVYQRNLDVDRQKLAQLADLSLAFSDRVALYGDRSVVLGIKGSLRLFGGLQSLLQKVAGGLDSFGCEYAIAVAPSRVGANWLRRYALYRYPN